MGLQYLIQWRVNAILTSCLTKLISKDMQLQLWNSQTEPNKTKGTLHYVLQATKDSSFSKSQKN